ncbi:MAG: hypothetical protein D6702_09590 [Planctomycetota bacterium]|nr:MAG: hypothetical protein D6702_09590 [Planctomycetota bacterium]
MRSGFRPDFRAVRLLFFLLLALGPSAGCVGPEGGEEPSPQEALVPAPAEEEPDLLAQARAALAAGDTNRALNRIEDSLPDHRDDAAVWQLYGDTLLRFVDESIAAGKADPGVVEGCLYDAEHAFDRVLELQPGSFAAAAGRVRALAARGEAEAAWQAVEAALPLAGDELDPVQARIFGRAGLALTAARVQAGAGVPAAARRAEELLGVAVAAGVEGAVLDLSDLLAWEGLREDARRVLVEHLCARPRDAAAIDRLKNLDAADPAILAADLERVRSRRPDDGFLLWYLGEARFRQQQAAVAAGDFLAAYEAIDRAEECFLQSQALEPDFAASCQEWLFLVRNARGWALWNEGRVDDAAQAFLASLEAAPERLEPEPKPASLRLGIEAVMGHYFARERDMAKARAFLRRVTALHDGEAMWWNNLGLACRDLAEPRARGGEPVEGELLELFEESWAAYTRAVELAPDDPNIVNDRALIAVYYLDHDLDLAESELHRAIELGTRALAGIDREADPEAWQRVDMAIGDAWENLAYLDLMRRRRTDRAEHYLEQSSQHYPWQDRGGVKMLRGVLERLRAGDQDS